MQIYTDLHLTNKMVIIIAAIVLLLACSVPMALSQISPLILTGDISTELESGKIIQVNAEDQMIDWEDGKCTLSEAILSANRAGLERPTIPGECANGNGNDTITFEDVSTVILTQPYGSDPIYNRPTALPPITSTITISGGIQGIVIKRAFDAIEPFRILQIEGTDGKLTLDNITLQASNPVTPGFAYRDYTFGGSIILYDQASLTLTNQSLITDTHGGGISALRESQVTLVDSMIISGAGRGISAGGNSYVTLRRSIVKNMTDGGGLAAGGNSTLELVDSYVGDNIASYGGGIQVDHTSNLLLLNSDIVSNTIKGGSGAGIRIYFTRESEQDNYGSIIIKNSRITHNRCQIAGPSSPGFAGGIFAESVKDMTIIGSQISYNDCLFGAILIRYGSLSVENSQIRYNTKADGLNLGIFTDVRLKNTYINHNSVMGVSSMGRLEILDSHILSNTGSGISFSNPLHSDWKSGLTVCNSSIIGNGVGASFSGRSVEESDAIKLINNHISHNGRGINIWEGFLIIENSELAHNAAQAKADSIIVTRKRWGPPKGPTIPDSSSGDSVEVETDTSDFYTETISFAEGSAIRSIGGKVVLRNSNIMDNSNTAITGTGSITATHNWWGQPDGPSGAGPGNGDSVGEGIDFSDFQTQPIAIDEVEFPCMEEEKVFLPWVERRE